MALVAVNADSTLSYSQGKEHRAGQIWRAIPSNRKNEYTFEHFMAEFDRSYADPAELELRRSIFEKNLAAIHAQNAAHAKGASHWVAGVNKFTDRTRAELPTGLVRSRRARHRHAATTSTMVSRDLPAAVDWRDKGVVTPVKDQGPCGSCWAFSATETIESAVALATGKLLELAPQELVDCVTNIDHCGGVGGCGGATQELGYAYVMLNGMAPGIAYPYHAHDGPCRVGTHAAPGRNTSAVVGVTGFVQLPPNDNEALQQAVALHGPVAISVDAAWPAYESGVFDGCSNTTSKIDHGVQVVGYGEEDGSLYWLVRNSWGENWGDKGYIKLLRYPPGKPHCQDDPDSSSGSGCETDPKNITVCGQCGLLSDSSYPTGGYVI